MMNYFILGSGIDRSEDIFYSQLNGIYISSDTYLNSPLFDYREYEIPSRTGNVILTNKRLHNVIRRFDCYIHETQDIDEALTNLKKYLYRHQGYIRILTSYDNPTNATELEEVYQYGYLAQELEFEPFNQGSVVKFSLYFSCIPYKYFGSIMPWTNIGSGRTLTILNEFDDEIQWLKNNSSYNVYSPTGTYFLTDKKAINGGASNTIIVNGYGRYVALYEYDNNSDAYRFVADGMGEINTTFTAQYTSSSVRVLTPIENWEEGNIRNTIGYFITDIKVNNSPKSMIEFYLTPDYNYEKTDAFGFDFVARSGNYFGFHYTLASNPNLNEELSNIHYVINGQVVYFDVNQFVTDYGDEWIKANLWTYTQSLKYLRIDLDLINKTSELVGDSIQLDMSKYIAFIGDINNERSDIVVGQANSNDNLYLVATPEITVDVEWWKL